MDRRYFLTAKYIEANQIHYGRNNKPQTINHKPFKAVQRKDFLLKQKGKP